MKAKATDTARFLAGVARASNRSEFLDDVETLREGANICFQCSFESNCRDVDAREAPDRGHDGTRIGAGFDVAGAPFGADGE
jgi:hypothetical protein